MLRVYIDNDVTSARGKDKAEKRTKEEADALARLDQWHTDGLIVLATSRQSAREMERAPAKYQSQLKAGLNKLELAQDDHIFLGSFTVADQYGGSITNPLVSDNVDEQLYSQLSCAGLKHDDAKHLMYAVHNRYDHFLTWDGDFLNCRAELKRLCPSIEIQRPEEFVAEFSRQLSP